MGEEHKLSLSVGNIRISRPTTKLVENLRFYCDGLGLPQLFSFPEDISGYSGVVLGVPGQTTCLEFCVHRDGFQTCEPPTNDNLVVFYLEKPRMLKEIIDHMTMLGFEPVKATNSHWDIDGVTFEDPDGWRVVLMLNNNLKN